MGCVQYEITGDMASVNPLQIAVIVHVYNPALWAELATYLRNIPLDFSVFVSVPVGTDPAFVLADFPKARVINVRNIGRDVAPFLQLLPELQAFDVVCKMHSKSHDEWRAEALRAQYPDRARIRG